MLPAIHTNILIILLTCARMLILCVSVRACMYVYIDVYMIMMAVVSCTLG